MTTHISGIQRWTPKGLWDLLQEELSLIHEPGAQLSSSDRDGLRKSTSNPFISGYASIEAENAGTTGESEFDIISLGYGCFPLLLLVRDVEPGYEKIHAIC